MTISVRQIITCVVATSALILAADGLVASTFDGITYRDSGGFTGAGTGKALWITADGKLETATRDGRRTAIHLDSGELTELNDAVAAVPWGQIERWYRKTGAADLVVRDLIVVIGGARYETHVDELTTPPASLRRLFNYLDSLYRRGVAR